MEYVQIYSLMQRKRLDFAGISGQMQFQVNPQRKNFYASWRAKTAAAHFLHDENFPTERLLQAIWQHQRLRREELKTADGKMVRIFHPGFASLEGGPDFRGAVLQIGGDAPKSGDIEIDLDAGGWRAHGHNSNPNFKNVLLHVVWEIPKTKTIATPPILCLQDILDSPLTELSLSLENESLRALPESSRGKCCAPLRELNEAKLLELLNEAADVRFQNKAEQFRARAKNAGWEQALWENLFRALGYKHNIWPMQSLAEMKSQWMHGGNSSFALQARLLGVGNLLPEELTRAQKSSDGYLREIWDVWWRERDGFENCILPRAIWKFHGLRPANHPQRRLALASHWLTQKDFVVKIEKWIAAEIAKKKLLPSLFEILQIERDEFWSWHWTFKSARLKKPQPLIGDARVTDLAVNIILPWLWVRAKEGNNLKIQQEVKRRYFLWPSAEDNSILKLARQRLLGEAGIKIFRTAAAQQGLIQIVRDFCEHSNAICDHCRFPELVKGWKSQ